MKKITQKMTLAAAAAMSASLMVAAPAQANTISHEYSAPQVSALARDIANFNSAVCGYFDWPWDVACEAGAANANGGMLTAFQGAADHNCGIRIDVVATGSGNSWDRSRSTYTRTGSGCLKESA